MSQMEVMKRFMVMQPPSLLGTKYGGDKKLVEAHKKNIEGIGYSKREKCQLSNIYVSK